MLSYTFPSFIHAKGRKTFFRLNFHVVFFFWRFSWAVIRITIMWHTFDIQTWYINKNLRNFSLIINHPCQFWCCKAIVNCLQIFWLILLSLVQLKCLLHFLLAINEKGIKNICSRSLFKGWFDGSVCEKYFVTLFWGMKFYKKNCLCQNRIAQEFPATP